VVTEYTGRKPSLETKNEDERGSLVSNSIVTVVLGHRVNRETIPPSTAKPESMGSVILFAIVGTVLAFSRLCHVCGERVMVYFPC